MRTNRPVSVAVATACLIGLGACGSSGSGGESLKALAGKANGICATAEAASRALTTPTNINNAKQAAAYFDKLEPITTRETNALAALKPNSAAKAKWNAYIAAQKAGDALLKTIRSKADSADASGQADLAKVPAAGKAIASAATAVGASTCASGG